MNTNPVQVCGSVSIWSRSHANLEHYFATFSFLPSNFFSQDEVFQLSSLIFEVTYSSFVMLSLSPLR